MKKFLSKLKRFLVEFQNNTLARARRSPNDYVHFFFGCIGNFLVITFISLLLYSDKGDYEFVRNVSLISTAILWFILELLQKYWLGGKNNIWKILRGWFAYWVSAILLSVMIPLIF